MLGGPWPLGGPLAAAWLAICWPREVPEEAPAGPPVGGLLLAAVCCWGPAAGYWYAADWLAGYRLPAAGCGLLVPAAGCWRLAAGVAGFILLAGFWLLISIYIYI